MAQMSEEEFLKVLQTTFINETELMLEDFDEALFSLETSEQKEELLNRIFRVLHSIKGSARSIGFVELAHFSHCAEDLLCALRVHSEALTQDCISTLLQVSDVIKAWIPLLKDKNSQTPNTEILEETLRKLSAQIENVPACSLPKNSTGTPSVDSCAEADFCIWSPEPSLAEIKVPQEIKEQPKLAIEEVTVNSIVSKKTNTSTVVKIDSERIDALLNVVGELVVLKGQLMSENIRRESDERLVELTHLIDKAVRELQDRTLSMRMTSLKPVFLKLQRGVRDVSIKLDKEVDFEMSGEDTEIDRTLIDLLADPLMHIVRNAVDHGLESKDNRVSVGKLGKGKISISAERRGGRMVIAVKDDGGGISRDKIIKKAVERGLLGASADVSSWPDKRVFEFLLQPGFSTAETVTDFSGRGVGLDVVRSNLEEIKGKLEIESTFGKGSCFRLSIPLTTAIVDAMLVKVSNTTFVIPIDAVQEFVQLSEMTTIKTSVLTTSVNIRGTIMPVFHLQTLLDKKRIQNLKNVQEERGVLVIVQDHNRTIALRVDSVIGQSQIVVKGLSSVFEDTIGIGGAALLEDGGVGLILDVEGVNRFFDELDCKINAV